MTIKQSKKIEIDDNCPSHGNSKVANDRFWNNPYTCHWGCRCKGIGRTELIPSKERNK
jgi:hypothetical protein